MGRTVASRPRSVLFDLAWNYGNDEGQNRIPNAITVHQPSELATAIARRYQSRFAIVYQPEFHPAEHFYSLCRFLARVGKALQGVTFAIDEVQDIDGKQMSDVFGLLARCGRHKRVSLLYTCQRPADCPVTLRGVSRYLSVFRLSDKTDLDFFRGTMPPDLLAKLPTLANRQYFRRGDGGTWSLVTP